MVLERVGHARPRGGQHLQAPSGEGLRLLRAVQEAKILPVEESVEEAHGKATAAVDAEVSAPLVPKLPGGPEMDVDGCRSTAVGLRQTCVRRLFRAKPSWVPLRTEENAGPAEMASLFAPSAFSAVKPGAPPTSYRQERRARRESPLVVPLQALGGGSFLAPVRARLLRRHRRLAWSGPGSAAVR